MNLLRAVKRSLFYAQKGYSLSSLPFMFLGYASSIYYLAIQNVPILIHLFPRFTTFLFVAAVTLPVFCIGAGYVFMKRSFLFRSEIEVQTEANHMLAHNWNIIFQNQLTFMKQQNCKPTPEYVRLMKYWQDLDERLGWTPP